MRAMLMILIAVAGAAGLHSAETWGQTPFG